MARAWETCDLRDFTSSITPSPETTDRDVEILKQEVEAYLRELKAAVCADLQRIDAECCPEETSP